METEIINQNTITEQKNEKPESESTELISESDEELTLREALNVVQPTINAQFIPSPEYYKNILDKFWTFLKSDWRRWVIIQIKNTMLIGKTTMYIANLENKMWKKGKTLLTGFKLDPKQTEFYNKKYNIVITDPGMRNIITFLTSLGMTWYIVPEWTTAMVTNKYYSLYVRWSL